MRRGEERIGWQAKHAWREQGAQGFGGGRLGGGVPRGQAALGSTETLRHGQEPHPGCSDAQAHKPDQGREATHMALGPGKPRQGQTTQGKDSKGREACQERERGEHAQSQASPLRSRQDSLSRQQAPWEPGHGGELHSVVGAEEAQPTRLDRPAREQRRAQSKALAAQEQGRSRAQEEQVHESQPAEGPRRMHKKVQEVGRIPRGDQAASGRAVPQAKLGIPGWQAIELERVPHV